MLLGIAITLALGLITLCSGHSTIHFNPTDPPFNASCENRHHPPPFLSYHIHVLYWQNNNDSHYSAMGLRHDFNMAFNLTNNTEGSIDVCNNWPYPPTPIRLCMYDVNNYPDGPFLTAQYSWFIPTDRVFDTLPWIMQHRGDLDVLFHPNSGCQLEDHLKWPLWGGNVWEIDDSVFGCEYPGCGQKRP